MKNLKTNWLLKHAITVFSCVLIIVLGITFLTHADPVTTTIGENIATNDLSITGNITSGTWQGTVIATQYGGTGQDFSASTGILKITAGTASVITDSSTNWDAAYTHSQVGHLPLAGGTLTGGLTVDGVTGLVDADIPDTITASNYLPLAGGTLTADLTIQETGDAKLTIHSNTDSPTEDSKLLVVQKGTTPSELFSVDEDGDVAIANDLAVSGNTTLSGNLNLSQNELKNAVLEKLSSFPSSPTEGQVFWHTDNNKPYWYDADEDADVPAPRWRTDTSGATFVVAASDSQNKEGADYVCSGENDQVEIQAAIDALPAAGGRVYLAAGQYNINATIDLIAVPLLMLEGSGGFRGAYLKLSDGANCDMFNINKMYLHMSNLFIDGNKANQIGTYHGLNISYVRYSYFDHLWIQDFTGNGIRIIPTAYTLDTHFMEINVEDVDGAGWYVETGADQAHTLVRFFLEGGYSYGNEIGMWLNGTNIHHFAISNYDFEYNDKEGVLIGGARATTINGGHIITNSLSASGTYSGVKFTNTAGATGAYRNLISGVNFYSGATATQKHCVYMELAATENAITGCQMEGGYTDSPIGSDGGESLETADISNIRTRAPFLNSSGATIGGGELVVLDPTDDTGNSIKTTTTANDPLVIGVASGSIAAGATDFITTQGWVRYIKVDGTVDIAAGDFIATSTVAGVGVKGTVGGGNCIAIALQNYSTDAVAYLKARVIYPR